MKGVRIQNVSSSDTSSLLTDLNQTLDSITSESSESRYQSDISVWSDIDDSFTSPRSVMSQRSPHNSLASTKLAQRTVARRLNVSDSCHYPIEVAELPYTIVRTTASLQTHPARSIYDQSTKQWWACGLGNNHELVLSLPNPALLGSLMLANRSTRSCQVFVSLVDKPDQYILMFDGRINPHRVSTFNCGYLPSRFVKIRCLTAESSIFFVRLFGVR